MRDEGDLHDRQDIRPVKMPRFGMDRGSAGHHHIRDQQPGGNRDTYRFQYLHVRGRGVGEQLPQTVRNELVLHRGRRGHEQGPIEQLVTHTVLGQGI